MSSGTHYCRTSRIAIHMIATNNSGPIVSERTIVARGESTLTIQGGKGGSAPDPFKISNKGNTHLTMTMTQSNAAIVMIVAVLICLRIR
jgi:hypothetical protein